MLAKRLYLYLIAADCNHRTLRELGWFEFLLNKVAESADARILGAAAIHHLLIDSSGTQISHDDRVVYAVLAFVESEQAAGLAPSAVSRGLAIVLSKPPVSQAAIEHWFLRTFP